MKILQKILSHGLLIAFFIAVFFVYLYRGDLFPQWFDEQAQTGVAPSESAAGQSSASGAQEAQPVHAEAAGTGGESQAVVHEPTQLIAETVDPPTVTESASAAVPVAVPLAAQSETGTDVPAAGIRPAEPAAPTADATTAAQYRPVGSKEAARQSYKPVAEVPDSVTTTPEFRPLKAKKPPPPAKAEVPADADFQSQLDQARQHYWRRDMPAAEQAYRRLTESHPERAELWGELGNLFFSQNERVQATDAYYRAIELLIEQGDAEQARQLLGAMYQLDAEKANELETRLRLAGS
jgi:hypothetical protein